MACEWPGNQRGPRAARGSEEARWPCSHPPPSAGHTGSTPPVPAWLFAPPPKGSEGGESLRPAVLTLLAFYPADLSLQERRRPAHALYPAAVQPLRSLGRSFLSCECEPGTLIPISELAWPPGNPELYGHPSSIDREPEAQRAGISPTVSEPETDRTGAKMQVAQVYPSAHPSPPPASSGNLGRSTCDQGLAPLRPRRWPCALVRTQMQTTTECPAPWRPPAVVGLGSIRPSSPLRVEAWHRSLGQGSILGAGWGNWRESALTEHLVCAR